MKPAPFDYVRPSSVAEAVQILHQAGGDGKVIAGGQSLTPVLAMRLARPTVLVDINRIPGLDSLRRSNDELRVGALVRHRELVTQTESGLLAEAARWIGHAAIRSRGTTGGSIAHADPAAELPVVAAALGASVEVVGAEQTRVIAAGDLFAGPLQTTLAPDEVIVGLRLPVPGSWGFAELSRRHGDFGLVTVVAACVAGRWRVAVGGVGPVPVRPAECESLLNGGALTADRIDQASAAAAAEIPTTTDLHAPAAYRKAMISEYTSRALRAATARSDHATREAQS